MFVSFEGIDGCGKSTQLEKLRDWLSAQSREVVATREPGGTALAEAVREFLLHGRSALSSRAELMLFGAARAQHVAEIIRPALERGAVVLSDRFSDSSLAYQGGGLDLNAEFIGAMNSFATDDLQPDLTFLFDVPIEIALARRARGRGENDRIEARGSEFQERVREAFLALARAESQRIVVVDATDSAEKVFETVKREWEARFTSDLASQ